MGSLELPTPLLTPFFLNGAKGVEGSAREIEILQVFAGQARRRVKSNFNKIDDNDDELLKSLAVAACNEEKFAWDNA